MVFDTKLLDVLACPVCKGKLKMGEDKQSLVCRFDRLSYAVEEGIPVLIEAHATTLTSEQLEQVK